MAPGCSPASELSPSPSPSPPPPPQLSLPSPTPPLSPAPPRLSLPSSSLLPTGLPLRRTRVIPLAKSRAATANPTPVAVKRLGGESQALVRPDGARGPGVASTRLAGTGFRLPVAARSFASGLSRVLRRECSGVGRGEAVGEAIPELRAAALRARRALHRPPRHGGELSASARHLAALRRLPADRRTTLAPEAAPAASAACLRACVRCRACVSCAARPLTSGCIVTCVWSPVYDVRVRGGDRTPPRMQFIRY